MLYTGLPLFFYCCFFYLHNLTNNDVIFYSRKMGELYLKCVSKTVCVCVWWHTAVTYSCLLCQSTWLQSELTHWPCAVIRRRGQLSCEQPYDLANGSQTHGVSCSQCKHVSESSLSNFNKTFKQTGFSPSRARGLSVCVFVCVCWVEADQQLLTCEVV